MEDTRVSIRLTPEEHKKLKILAIQKNTNIQEILHSYIKTLLKEEENNEK